MDSLITQKSVNIKLMVENKRLNNELLFTNKCLNELKTHLIKIHSKYETLIDCEDKQHFRLLSLRLDQLNDETYGSDGSHIQTEYDVTETDATDGQQLTVKSIDKTYDLNDKRLDKKSIVRQTDPAIRPRVGPQRMSQPIEALNKKVTIKVINKIATQNSPKTPIATQSQSQDKKVVYLVVNSGNQMTGHSSGTSASGRQLILVSLPKELRCHVIDCQFKCHSMDSLQNHFKVHVNTGRPKLLAGFTSLTQQREEIKQCYDSTTDSYHCRQTGCQKYFKRYIDIYRHMKNVHCEPRYVCYDPNCDKRFKLAKAVRPHYDVIHRDIKPPKPFECPVDGCDQRYPSAYSLAIHVKSHDNHERQERKRRRRELTAECYDSTTGLYHCRQTGCQKTFKTYRNVRIHVRETHGDRTVVCEHSDCDKRFKSHKMMKSHYKSMHSKVRLIKCPLGDCGREYPDRQSLNQHMIGSHPTEYSVYLKAKRSNNSFWCQHPGCGRGFSTRYTLLIHKSIHSFEPTIRCPKCPQLFRTTNLLVKHQVSQHNKKVRLKGSTDYRCEWSGCQYTGTLTALRIHTKTHTGEKPYACDWPECGKRYSTQVSLTGHLNLHKNLKPYACHWPGCEYRSAFSTNTTKHSKVFHQK